MTTITEAGIGSYASPSKVKHRKIALTNAEVLALNGTPVELIAAPGAGKTIKVISVSVLHTFATAAFATNVNLQIITDTATVSQFENAIVLTSTATRHLRLNGTAASGTTSTQLISNKSVKATVATGNPATGGGTITIFIAWSVLAD